MIIIDQLKKIITIFLASLIVVNCGDDHLELPEVVVEPQETLIQKDQLTIKFDEVYETIIQPRCVLCHNGNSAMGELDMQTAEVAYNNLVGIVSWELSNSLRVKAGDADPAASYLVAKIIEESDFRRLSRMPMSGAPLSENEIQLIVDWIEAGAQR